MKMNRHALFVGINDYRGYEAPSLPWAANDARVLSQYFAQLGYQTHWIVDATVSELKDTLKNFTRGLGKGDLFLFYFAGHGITFRNEACLACRKELAGSFESALLPIRELQELIDRDFDTVVISDACRTNDDGVFHTGLSSRDLQLVSGAEGAIWLNDTFRAQGTGARAIVYACEEGCPAEENPVVGHGVFSQALLEELRSSRHRVGNVRVDAGLVDRIGHRIDVIAASRNKQDANSKCSQNKSQRPSVYVVRKAPLLMKGRGTILWTTVGVTALLTVAAGTWILSEYPERCAPGKYAAQERYEKGEEFLKRRLFRKGNRENALTWIESAANDGCADAQFEMGTILRNGEYGRFRNEFEAVKWFSEAAKKDHAGSLAMMGWYHLLGKAGVPKDETKAMDFIHRAADKDNGVGLVLLGIAYQYGELGVEKDVDRAEELFRKAAGKGALMAKSQLALLLLETSAERGGAVRKEGVSLLREAVEEGVSEAQREYGRILLFGLYGVPADASTGLSLLQSAAEDDDDIAQYILARCLLGEESVDVTRDDRDGVKWLKSAAENNYAEAQVLLGDLLLHGRHGLAKDEAKAAEWYQRAAAKEHAGAMYQLAVMYMDGLGGLPKDEAKAAELFRKAAEQGFAAAQYNLAVMYMDGLGGLPKDEAKAVELYERAIGLGDTLAMYNLAVMYGEGRGGLPKDEAKASELYERAVELGNKLAMNNLARMYEYGRGGLPKDEAKAAELYERAAELGNELAMCNLAAMYEEGRGGLPKDEAKAAKLYERAAEQGYALAQCSLGAMYEYARGDLHKNAGKALELYRQAEAQGDVLAHSLREMLDRKLRHRPPVEQGDGTWANPDEASILVVSNITWVANSEGGVVTADEIWNLSGWNTGSLECMIWLCKSWEWEDFHSGIQLGRGMLSKKPLPDGERLKNVNVPIQPLPISADGDFCSVISINELGTNGTWRVVGHWNGPRCHWSAPSRPSRPEQSKASPGSLSSGNSASLTPSAPAAPSADELYRRGKTFANPAGGFSDFLQAARMGHTEAQYEVAKCYWLGQGTARNAEQAVYWWNQAAAKGHVKSMHNLGIAAGRGEQAVFWYRKAADRGNVTSMYHLGLLAMVNSIPTTESVRWWTQAANLGYAPAQRDLAKCYETGTAVPRDLARARDLLQRAAAQGDSEAHQRLSSLSRGNGPSLDDALDIIHRLDEGLDEDRRTAVEALR